MSKHRFTQGFGQIGAADKPHAKGDMIGSQNLPLAFQQAFPFFEIQRVGGQEIASRGHGQQGPSKIMHQARGELFAVKARCE